MSETPWKGPSCVRFDKLSKVLWKNIWSKYDLKLKWKELIVTVFFKYAIRKNLIFDEAQIEGNTGQYENDAVDWFQGGLSEWCKDKVEGAKHHQNWKS